MRQVDRSSVGIPPCLDRDLSAEIKKIREGAKPRTDIYRHEEVMTRLQVLYLEKCFLCEKFVGKKGIVEHFLPWHKAFPERAYEWKNLNLSCDECNSRKRQKPYRIPADSRKPAKKTVLIDPSKPPFGYRVEALIQFNKHSEAVAGGKQPMSSVVINTIKFLNDTKPLRYRNRRWDELTEIVFQSDCKTIWWEFRDMRSISPNDWDDSEYSEKMAALERGDAVYQMFLTERSPFHTCMKSVVFEILRLSVGDFKQMSDTYRKYKGLATD